MKSCTVCAIIDRVSFLMQECQHLIKGFHSFSGCLLVQSGCAPFLFKTHRVLENCPFCHLLFPKLAHQTTVLTICLLPESPTVSLQHTQKFILILFNPYCCVKKKNKTCLLPKQAQLSENVYLSQ